MATKMNLGTATVSPLDIFALESGVEQIPEPIFEPRSATTTAVEAQRYASQSRSKEKYRSKVNRNKVFTSRVTSYRNEYGFLLSLSAEPVELKAFERAMNLLHLYFVEMSEEAQYPSLSDGEDGAVDILWKSPKRTILGVVDPDEPVYFSATDGSYTLSGYIPDDRVEPGLLAWIKR